MATDNMSDEHVMFPDILPDLGAWTGDVRGRLVPNQSLAEVTRFRAGGPAQLFFAPADEDDLVFFLKNLDPAIKVTVIGLASNLLVRDGGIEGVVIRLSAKGFGQLEVLGDHKIAAGASSTDFRLANAAAEAGIDGLAFYRGIPGGVGGALYMNAGCYKTETRDRMVSLRAVTRAGEVIELSNADMGYEYRKSHGPRDVIFTRAVFQGEPGDPDAIKARMEEITSQREQSQPIKANTGGSTFKNPLPHSSWKVIDAAGMRGYRVGGAHVSEKHCNFLINDQNATAHDIETLGETVRQKVREHSGISLKWEIRRMGRFVPGREVREFLDGEVFTGAV